MTTLYTTLGRKYTHSLGKLALQRYRFGLRIVVCMLHLSLQVLDCVSHEAVPVSPDGSQAPTQLPLTHPCAGAAELEGSIETWSLNMTLFLFLHRKFPRAVCVQEETICSRAAQHVSVWTAACPGTISGNAWREPIGTSTATAVTWKATMLMWVWPLAQRSGVVWFGSVKNWIYNAYNLFTFLWFYMVPVCISMWKCSHLHYQSFHGEWFKENKQKRCQHLVFSLVPFSSSGEKHPFSWGMKGVGRLKLGDAVSACELGKSKE